MSASRYLAGSSDRVSAKFIAVIVAASLVALLAVSLAPRAALAQATTAGVLAGSVLTAATGHTSAPVVGATVTLTSTDAPPRSTMTDADGAFQLRELASGVYTAQVTAAGFAPTVETVAIAVGRTTHLSVVLQPASLVGIRESVTVSAAPVTFDTTQSSSVINIDRDRVEELPIPSRDFLSFVLLSPQVAAANPALAAQGAGATGVSFSFGGLRPSSNAVYLDNASDNDEYTGGSRTQLSPEAVSDFQIVNHGFAAQSGGAAGGAIDVATRSGVNRLHGDAFTFVQNGAMNAAPPLEYSPYRPDESRVRAGIALGGPLQRDRTFYYIAAEQEMARGEDDSGFSPAAAASLNTALSATPTLAALHVASGYFPTVDEETEISARVDRTLTARHSLMARYALTNSRNVNDGFATDELTDRSARGSAFVADNSLTATLSSTLSPALFLRTSLALAQRHAVLRTAEPSAPGVEIAGTVLLGTPFSGNDNRYETQAEGAETFGVERRHHFFQAGLRAEDVALRTLVPDGAQGLFVFRDLAALEQTQPDFFVQSFGNFRTNLRELRLSAFAQDHWTPAPSLTLDFGLRYDNNLLPQGFALNAHNVSPRVGLAWTPRKTLVVRAGFGTFYDRFEMATINRVIAFSGSPAFTQVVEDQPAAAVLAGDLPPAPLATVAPSVWSAAPGLRNPYSEVASVAVEQQLPWQSTLTGEYQFVRGVHLGRTSNSNLAPPIVLTATNAAAAGISAPTPQQLGRLVFTTARLDPAYDAINQFATSAGSNYSGATVTFNRQFQDDLELLAGYTFSKTTDDASSDSEEPQNPYAPHEERAPSLEDQRQRLTLSGLWLIGPDLDDPADAVKNAHPGLLMRALIGLEFAPILSLTSGYRANPLTGLDSNREHIYPFAARPEGIGRNTLRAPFRVDADLRILRIVPLRSGHLDIVVESFNLLNHANIARLNTVYGSLASPAAEFATPIEATTARRVQFSLDYEF